jgi:predicted ATPase/DNA-binding SARP family transcriptional activator
MTARSRVTGTVDLPSSRRGGSETTNELSIDLLGAPVVTVDGQPLQVDTRKATAVLAIIAVEGATPRVTLAARLWPESDDAHARAALRRTLSVLGSGLGGRWLTTTQTSVGLDRGDTRIDTDEFAEHRQHLATHGHAASASCRDCLSPLRRMSELHRGEFMDGFVLRDNAEFSEWQGAHAERFRRELSVTLDRLTRLEAESGDLDAALECALRMLDLDELSEEAHCRVMLLHGRRGERSEAIRRYRDCAAVLDRELGVKPLARTTALYEAILEGRLDRTTLPTSTSPGTRRADAESHVHSRDLPFVGRDRELSDALDHLAVPGGRLLVVHGEAGIGKTRFVDEVEARLHQQSVPVLGVNCHPDERRLALSPIVALLRSAVARPGAADRIATLPPDVRGEAVRLLPALADGADLPPPAPLDAPGSHARFLDAVLTTLITASAPRGTRPVVMVEDLHAADDATLHLLSYALRHLPEHAVGLVLTWRTEEMASNPSSAELQRAIRGPTNANHSLVTELRRLTSEATGDLCRAALGAAPSPDVVQRVAYEAEGLPLAVIEYLRWLLELGENPSSDWPIPSGVRELVTSRLDGLSETALQLTTTAAVLGHTVDLRLLSKISGRSDDETADGADELLAKGILRPGAAGIYSFSHEKIRTIAYERATPARRRLLHARTAAALKNRARRRGSGQLAAVIAEHARLGGDEEAAAEWSVRAGDHAADVFANTEARSHYERALALAHPDPTAVHRRLGRLKLLDGDYPGALGSYETAAALAPDPMTLAAVEHEIGALHLRRGQWDAARAHLESALQLLGEERTGIAARVTTDLGLTELQAGILDVAQEHATRALALAEQGTDRQARAQARNLMGLLARRLDQTSESQRHLEHAAALASTLSDPSAYIAALNNLALSTADAGDLERAIELLGTALERCERQGDRHRAAALHNNLADLYHRSEEEDRAMDHLKRAVSLFADIGGPAPRDPEIWKLVDW